MIFTVPFGSIPFSSADTSALSGLVLIYDSSYYIDSIRFVDNIDASVEPRWFGPSKRVHFVQGKEYTISFNALCAPNILTNPFPIKMDIYLSTGAFQTITDPLGTKLGTLVLSQGNTFKIFGNQSFNIVAPQTGDSYLRFITYGGIWNISQISIQSASDFEFSPSFAFFSSRVRNKRLENVQFKINLFDVNSNAYGYDILTNPIFFVGENSYIQGSDNRIVGQITMAASGSGPILLVNSSASYINIASKTTTLPVSASDLPTYIGPPIISVYSGSTPYSGSNPNNVGVLGFQIVAGGNVTASFLDYSTSTGKLTLRGDIALLSGSSLSQSFYGVSGSASGTFVALQQLVNGVYAGGTYLSNTQIVAPIIAGQLGYFSQSFGVGNISGGVGIILTALGYTDITGSFRSNFPAIYIGNGQYGNVNTPFFVASSSFGSLFSLGDKVTFDNSSSVLTVKGQLNVIDSASANTNFQDVKTVMANYIAYSPFGFFISHL
jgi:hypothetical protein